MTYRGPWNAAGTRHRQTPRKYKAVGPVGDASNRNAPECPGCRMYVCSCPPKTTIKREARITAVAGGSFTCDSLPFDGAELVSINIGKPAPSQPMSIGTVTMSGGHAVSVNYDKVADEVFKRLADAIHAGMMTLPVNAVYDKALHDERQRQLMADMQPEGRVRCTSLVTDHVNGACECFREFKQPERLKCERCSKLSTNLINGLGACCRPVAKATTYSVDDAVVMLEGSPLKVGDRLRHPDTGDTEYQVQEVRTDKTALLDLRGYAMVCSLDGYTRVSGPLSAEYLDRVDGAIKSDGRASARSASSGLTGKGEGTKTTTSSSMGLCKTPDEAGKNQTSQLMFEGRPLCVGDKLIFGPLTNGLCIRVTVIAVRQSVTCEDGSLMMYVWNKRDLDELEGVSLRRDEDTL